MYNRFTSSEMHGTSATARCVHLIETSDGLLLIDAGNIGAAPMLVYAIWSLGFRLDNVK